MSKIGKTPIIIKDGITANISGNIVNVTGPKGNFKYTLPLGIHVKVEGDKVIVSQDPNALEDTKALFGLVRATIANMVYGASTGFEKKLELSGVGYRAQLAGADLNLSLGFSHPVKIKAIQGITFGVIENVVTISGGDKALVGDIDAKIRAIRPTEPYKGKGIKYVGEKIRRKAGKAAKAVGGAGAK